MSADRIVVAVAGASGSIYAQRLLARLAVASLAEVAVVFSHNAKQIWAQEIGDLPSLPFRTYDERDFTAPFASGSSRFRKMVIVPCSTGTLARIATGATDNLITRGAEVMLKERRQLICVLREAPYSLIHLDNMRAVTMAGGIICPATPSFYSRPASIEAVVDTVVFRVLDLLGIANESKRWGEYETRVQPG
jgi:flavin prenyltransferase